MLTEYKILVDFWTKQLKKQRSRSDKVLGTQTHFFVSDSVVTDRRLLDVAECMFGCTLEFLLLS